jgi:hypothetical protein
MIGLRLGDNMKIEQKRPPTTIINGSMTIINGREEESSSSSEKYTIEIAQKDSHPIDTLCWLHANQPWIDDLTPLRTSASANTQNRPYNTFQMQRIRSKQQL